MLLRARESERAPLLGEGPPRLNHHLEACRVDESAPAKIQLEASRGPVDCITERLPEGGRGGEVGLAADRQRDDLVRFSSRRDAEGGLWGGAGDHGSVIHPNVGPW